MTDVESNNANVVRAYLEALQEFKPSEEIARFFHPEVRQIEHPNRLNPKGSECDLAALLKRVDLGRKLLREQAFRVLSLTAHGDRVAVEAKWTGTVDVPLPTLEPGMHLKAHIAMFFELADGRITRQRNYDCFEP